MIKNTQTQTSCQSTWFKEKSKYNLMILFYETYKQFFDYLLNIIAIKSIKMYGSSFY